MSSLKKKKTRYNSFSLAYTAHKSDEEPTK